MPKTFYSVDEMFLALEKERNKMRLHNKLWFKVKGLGHKLLRVPSRVRNVYQRARYGYGHEDLWNLDVHVAKTLSRALVDPAFHQNSYPHGEEFPTFESWIQFLEEASRDLAAYADNTIQNYERGQDAMLRFSKHFGSMWT